MSRLLPVFLFVAFAPHDLNAQVPPVIPEPPADYDTVTNPFSSATNFNIETVRGMVLRSDGVYAINTHASTVVHHADLLPGWEREWPTVNNPIAIAEWTDGLLVVGGSTWSLVEHDFGTGRIIRHVQLDAEPADIVVDPQRGEAYIACQGDNLVVRVDLASFQINARYPVGSQRPRFLYFEEDAAVGAGAVYVAPALSGNNTTGSEVIPIPNRAPNGSTDERSIVLDLDPLAPPHTKMPDEDLFRIYSTDPDGTSATPVLHNAGTLLTEHARNPFTGDYWMLSTKSLNADERSEDKHQGKFANAQLAITNNLGAPGRPEPVTRIDLDTAITGGKSVNTSMSFPYALAFHDAGYAAIASSTSDLITLVLPTGGRFVDQPIVAPPSMPAPVGNAIPRDLVFQADLLYVYCWGWNKILVYQINSPNTPPLWFDLGPDPLPLAMQRGRSTFYDAKRTPGVKPNGDAFHGAVTCNTCHPGGGMDLLGWELSDSANDIKDLMVTQSLLSIADTFPYHWRGERNLDHFNGAFQGLLGHQDKLTPAELDEFEAFVFSLQAPANPRQHVERKLTGQGPQGQERFLNAPNVLFGEFTCAECHQLPSGTNGDGIAEVVFGMPGSSTLDVSHLRQLRHKDQGPFPVTILDKDGITKPVTRAVGGFGLAHEGINFDVSDFVKPSTFNISAAEAAQITEFVRQFDQGIAPAAHRAYLVNGGNFGTMDPIIQNVLLAQTTAAKPWIDIAAIGSEFDPAAGGIVDLRWAYDARTGMFRVHDGSMAPRPWSAFQPAFTAGAQYLVLGLPPGNAFRFALDPDNDGLTDGQEASPIVFGPTNPRNRSSDGDAFDDGYEVQNNSDPNLLGPINDGTAPGLLPGTSLVLDHSTARFAKYRAQFTEPVTWLLRARDASTNAIVSETRGAAFQREATIHMHELYPSTPTAAYGGMVRRYVPELIITDQAGMSFPVTGLPFTAGDQLIVLNPPIGPLPPKVVVDELYFHPTPPVKSNGTANVSAKLRVLTKAEAAPLGGALPGNNRVVVARVLHRPNGSPTWTPATAALAGARVVPNFSLVVGGSPPYAYGGLPGDFVMSTQTGAMGYATFNFTLSGLATRDKVRLAVVAILEPAPLNQFTVFGAASLDTWDLPLTSNEPSATVPGATDKRGLTFEY